MSTVITENSGYAPDREFMSLSLIFTLVFMAAVTKRFPRLYLIFKKMRDTNKSSFFLTFYMRDFG